MFNRSFLTLVALTGLVAASSAQIVTYVGLDGGANATDPHPTSDTTAGQWDTAVGFYYVNTFENAAVGSFSALNNDPHMTVTGTDSLGNNQTVQNSPQGSPSSLYGYNTTVTGSKFVYAQGGTVTFTFGATQYAFGAYITGMQSAFGPDMLSWNDGSSQSLAIPTGDGSGGCAFVGFTDSNGFTSVTVTAGGPPPAGDYIGIDDVHYSSINPTPEPISMTLLGAGALALLRRRSSK
jgi:MYXO-CTERM domain-containing protein